MEMMPMCILFGTQANVTPIKLTQKITYYDPKEALLYRPFTDTSGMYMLVSSGPQWFKMMGAFAVVDGSLWYIPLNCDIEKVRKSSTYCSYYDGKMFKVQRWAELEYNTIRNVFVKFIKSVKKSSVPKGSIVFMKRSHEIYQHDTIKDKYLQDNVLKALLDTIQWDKEGQTWLSF